MLLFKTAPLGELIDADDKKRIVKGYGSYFDNMDSDGITNTLSDYLQRRNQNNR